MKSDFHDEQLKNASIQMFYVLLGKTALHYAASNGKEKVGALLIKNGTDVNAADKNGQTALHVAAKKSKSKILNVLIANGANADIVDDSGKTALHFAAQKGWPTWYIKI